jgi:hypothetical protein
MWSNGHSEIEGLSLLEEALSICRRCRGLQLFLSSIACLERAGRVSTEPELAYQGTECYKLAQRQVESPPFNIGGR